jgi:hypothetical protein
MRKEATYRASSVRIACASIMHRYASLREVDIFRVIFAAALELSSRSIAIPATSVCAPFCGLRSNRVVKIERDQINSIDRVILDPAIVVM